MFLRCTQRWTCSLKFSTGFRCPVANTSVTVRCLCFFTLSCRLCTTSCLVHRHALLHRLSLPLNSSDMSALKNCSICRSPVLFIGHKDLCCCHSAIGIDATQHDAWSANHGDHGQSPFSCWLRLQTNQVTHRWSWTVANHSSMGWWFDRNIQLTFLQDVSPIVLFSTRAAAALVCCSRLVVLPSCAVFAAFVLPF